MTAEPVSTYTEWTIRDGDGDGAEIYGWWSEDTARMALRVNREADPEFGPYTLVRRTWTAVDEDVPC